ncbi:MFS transporter [Arthrobacter sp. ISL-48]|uniref:MFS transporter n=1 Tax=Arthrobacter sp. ISL-48 TaxID=2819110 RepID=UPI001BE4FE18|nr:MFS transporter [Arthrobacter sp. ISL-48]MBT2534537.1 MFS transporter [Arthrobacter sp. ISL-48]
MPDTTTVQPPLQLARRRGPSLPLAVYVLAAGTFLMGTTEFVVAGLLPEVAADFGTTEAHAGWAITAFAIGMIIGAPVMPMLTLRLPRRVTLVMALGLFAVAHVVLALTDSFALLLLSRFAAAIATGTFWSVAAVVAAGLVGPERRSSALGIVLGGGMLATVVGVPLGSLGGQVVGWRGPFWALALLSALAIGAVASLVPSERTGRTAPSIRAEFAALRSGRLWLVLATCAAVTAGVLSVYSFISPLLTGRTGLSASYVPAALLLFGVGALAGNVVGGRLGDTRPFRTPVVTVLISLLAMAMLSIVSTITVATFVAFTVLGAVGLSANPVLFSLVTKYGGHGATLPSAMATSMFNVGTAIGTAITGAALTSTLGQLAPPVVGTTFAAIALILFSALVFAQRRSVTPTPAQGDV